MKKDCPESTRTEMDERIIPLVNMIKSLPGIDTFTSCGGHEETTDFSQCGIDEFLVGFTIDPDDWGLQSLGIITLAAKELKGGCAMVIAGITQRTPLDFTLTYTPSFQVIGVEGADPDELRSHIKIHLDAFNQKLATFT